MLLLLVTVLLLATLSSSRVIDSQVFVNKHYPECCEHWNASWGAEHQCFFRIPLVSTVPNTQTVLAFAEHRQGILGWGCSDGSGPSIAFRRSTDGDRSWSKLRMIATDTDPIHNRLQDGVVLGSALHSGNTTFVFYTSCYLKCPATQTYVIRSRDGGSTWSEPKDGNLTHVVPEMLQFGEGLGVDLGSGGLLVCGWIGLTHAANREKTGSPSAGFEVCPHLFSSSPLRIYLFA